MGNLSNYPNGFNQGVLLRDHPHYADAPGKVFFVGNNATLLPGEKGEADAAHNGKGGSFLQPFATIDYAVSQCKANRGDVIYVRPTHVETISAASSLDLDVAGLKLIGLGQGGQQPRCDFTAAAGTVQIAADDILIENMNFHANVTTITGGVVVEDGVDDIIIRGCSFDVETAGTDEFNNALTFTNDNSRCVIEDCVFDMGIAAAVRAIHLDADTEGLIIRRNYIRGDYSTACIGGDTTLSTDILIEDNLLINGEAGDIGTVECIELLTGTTGVIRNNDLVCNVASPDLSIVADSCFQFDNRYSETVNGGSSKVVDDIPNAVAYAPAMGLRAIENTSVALTGGDVADVFTVNNGAILVHMLAVEITTAVSANAALIHFESDPTRGASNTDIAEGTLAPDLASAAIGDWFAINGDSQDVMKKHANGTDLPMMENQNGGIVVPEGGIDLKISTSDPTTGIGTIHLLYSPLTPDAYVS